MWHSHPMGWTLVSNKKEPLVTHATTWMHLGNIILGERSQMLNTVYYMISLYEVSRKVKSKETESRWVLAWGWGWEWWVTENRPLRFGKDGDDENILKLDCDNGCTIP